MTQGIVMRLAHEALIQVIIIALPMLGVGLLVGLVVSIFQTTTSIQEQTLTFVPKILAILVSVMVFGYWMLTNMMNFTGRLFSLIPDMVR